MTGPESPRPGVPLRLVRRKRTWASPGLIVSLLAHGALLLTFVVDPAPERPDRILGDQFVTFLVPPDRTPADRDRADRDRVEVFWAEVPGQGTGPADPVEELGDDPASLPLVMEGVAQPGGDTATGAPAAPSTLATLDTVFTQFEVDSAVWRYPESAAPAYPADLLSRGIQGRAFVQFVVDTTGLVDLDSFRVIETTHPGFGRAVRDALPLMRFRPAISRGTKVRQLVEQSFSFRITAEDTLGRRRPPE
jgi:TonB family protein